MLDAYASYMLQEMLYPHTFAELETPMAPTANMFRSLDVADGQVIGLLLLDSHYRAFCSVIEREDLADDPRFAAAASRLGNLDLFYETITPDTARLTTEEFMKRAMAKDLPFAKVNGIEDLFEDPQALHNETFADFEDPEFGRIRHTNYPAKFERSPANVKRRAPKFGEHTAELLAELSQRAGQAAE